MRGRCPYDTDLELPREAVPALLGTQNFRLGQDPLGLASMRPCMVIFDIVVSGPEEGGDGVFAQEVSAGW
jgi:hypothetical protein